MAYAAAYRHEELQKVPRGYRVRSVKRGSHVVRIAFPPGPRKKGSGKVVEILHPNGENNPSCIVSNQAKNNPGELLIFGNPGTQLSREEKDYFLGQYDYWLNVEGATEEKSAKYAWEDVQKKFPHLKGKTRPRLNPGYVRRSLFHQLEAAAKERGETFKQESMPDGRIGYRYQGKLYTPGELADKLGVHWPNPRPFAGWKHFTKSEKNFLRSIHAPAPKNEEEVRAYKETLRKIDEINAKHRNRNARLTVPEKHQLKIAIATLNMPAAIAGVMGGPTKEQAREIIRRLTGKEPPRENPRRQNERQHVGDHQGISMYFEGISYNAPSLKLYGYSTDLALKRAIDRKLKGRQKPQAKNPDETKKAVKLFQSFHGRDPKDITEKHVSAEIRKDYAALGDLEYLKVTTPIGQTAQFNFEGDGVKLASSPDGKQLYCIGGNQNLAQCLDADSLSKDFIDLGECTEVQYLARKVHGDFEPVSYFHKFGEKTGARPQLAYDKLKKQIFFVGGEYFIKHDRGVSPGIEN